MLLNWVSWPMLHFVAISPPELPERFTARRYVTRLLLGGRLSIGEHTLDLQLVPGGSGGVPRHWTPLRALALVRSGTTPAIAG